MTNDDLQAALKRMDEDEEFRRGVIDKLAADANQLGEVRATLMVNFGKPFEGFAGGRLAQVADNGHGTHRMLFDVLMWLAEKANIDIGGKAANASVEVTPPPIVATNSPTPLDKGDQS